MWNLTEIETDNYFAKIFIDARKFLLESNYSYSEIFSRFQMPIIDDHEFFNWGKEYFDVIAKGNHQIALWHKNADGSAIKFSYDELYRQSNQAMNFLISLGAQKGDKMMLMLPNCPELWQLNLAAIKLGMVIVPATNLLSSHDIEYRLKAANVKFVVTTKNQLHKFSNIQQQFKGILLDGEEVSWHNFANTNSFAETNEFPISTKANDPMFGFFTSGTTSNPKLVIQSHRYPIGHLSTLYWGGLQKDDIHLNIAAAGWAKHAWSSFFLPLNSQACSFVYNYDRFDAKNVLQLLCDYPITSLCAPPTVWRILCQENLENYADKIKLRNLMSGGEPLNPEVIRRVKNAWGITIRECYGQSETTGVIAWPKCKEHEVVYGTAGVLMPGYQVALLNSDGQHADEGELVISTTNHSPGLMSGYEKDSEKSEKVLGTNYYRTGDRFFRDSNGLFTFLGREDDLFKSGGYRISPFELESLLLEYNAILEAAVIPISDEIKGHVPKAFIVLKAEFRDSSTIEDIQSFLETRCSAHQKIRDIQFVVELPKTISGKIQRNKLREAENVKVVNANKFTLLSI